MCLAMPVLPLSVTTLRYSPHPSRPDSIIYLLGTAHVSKESAIEARELVHQVRPDAVVLELCHARAHVLALKEIQVPTFQEMYRQLVHQKAKLWGIVYSWAMAQVADKLEVIPGEEFRAAFEAAQQTGAKVILGDRPIQATLERTWAALSIREKLFMLSELIQMGRLSIDAKELVETIEAMKDKDMITELIKDLGVECPSLLEPLIYERDLFLVHTLRRAAATFPVVVAVVGAGHCPGIRKNWEAEFDVDALLVTPCTEGEPSLLVAALWEWRWQISATVVAVGTVTCASGVLLMRFCRRR